MRIYNLVGSSLLTLVLLFSLHGALPAQASASLPGLESVTAADDALLAAVSVRRGQPVPASPVLSSVGTASAGLTTRAVRVATAPKPTPSPAPQPSPAPWPAPGKTVGCFNYTVKAGDDWQAIAARFGTTDKAIADATGMRTSETIYPGMVLRVPTSDQSKVQPALKAVAVPWTQVDRLWAIGTVAQVTDVWTGNVFYVMRRGGWAHADAEPVSTRDTAVMLSNYGGEWSWARRPIVVVINGQRIAASQNGMPHDGSSLNNGFPGHFCIHFLGSTTHGSSYTSTGVPTLDAAHQWCVKQAVGH